jgi:luciferase family oxidoreductase group 1
MLGYIGTQTKEIRIGAGAVLLPHYRPYHIAETYHLLATLFPRRIDLGIGRAPGGSAEVSMALSGNFLEQVKRMPESLDDLLRFLYNEFPKDHKYSKISPSPVPVSPPTPWLLGTSEKSAILAAEKGMKYAFGHFMSDADGPTIIKKYREDFAVHNKYKRPQTIIAISVICAETTEEAEDLALSSLLWKIQQEKGENENGVPTVETGKSYLYSAEELETMKQMRENMIIGNPEEVKERLNKLQQLYETDEFMIVTITHSYQARVKSYELLAKKILGSYKQK